MRVGVRGVTLVNPGTHEPCQHRWRWLDAYGLWYCPICRRTESDDDDPGEPGDGPVAA